jgi:hypothetical protein
MKGEGEHAVSRGNYSVQQGHEERFRTSRDDKTQGTNPFSVILAIPNAFGSRESFFGGMLPTLD